MASSLGMELQLKLNLHLQIKQVLQQNSNLLLLKSNWGCIHTFVWAGVNACVNVYT